MRLLFVPLAALAFASSALAQESAPQACPASGKPADLLTTWPGTQAGVSAEEAGELPAATPLAPSRPMALALHPAGAVTYLTLPKGAGEAASYGGLVRFTAPAAGRYDVQLAASAWVDMVRDGKPTRTASFGRGCAPVVKHVSFVLQPGDYVLEVSGSKQPVLPLRIERIAD